MIKNNGRFFIFYILILLIFSSCAGNPGKEKKVFTGIILDEKSDPVSEMEVNVKTASGKKVRLWTDDEGLFYISETRKGSFSIQGEKPGYTELDEKFEVHDLGKIYCFQVQTADSVFDDVEILVTLERYKEAVDKLKKINFGKNKELKECISFYKKQINRGAK